MGWGWDTPRWRDLNLPPSLTPEEAHFWLIAMTTQHHPATSMQQFADQLASETFTGKVDAALIHDRIAAYERGLPDEAVLVIANLLTAEQMFEAAVMPFASMQWDAMTGVRQSLIAGFTRYVLPYLTDKAIEGLRERLRRNWDPTKAPPSGPYAFVAEYYLAASLGMHRQVLEGHLPLGGRPVSEG